MRFSRITVFAGHYGSGKTNLSVNYAVKIKETRPKVVVCDLDIVNPYFRTADFAGLLREKGITVIASRMANTNVDAPSMPAETMSIFDDKDTYAVIDVGGDDRGALALGRYSGDIARGSDYDMLLVVNMYRPFTGDVGGVLDIKREIESAVGLPFTGIVNNSNIGGETKASDVTASLSAMDELSSMTGLPVKFTSARRDLKLPSGINVFPIDIYKKTIWKI